MGTFAYYTVLSLLVFVAVLLILLILIQKGRGGGLSSAFGGGGGSSAFGAKTGDVLTWATSIIFGVFIFLAVSLDLIVDNQFKTTLSSTAGAVPTMPMPASSTPDTSTPAPAPTPEPAASSPVSSVGNTVMQTLKNASTQAAGAVHAATQPAGKIPNGGR